MTYGQVRTYFEERFERILRVFESSGVVSPYSEIWIELVDLIMLFLPVDIVRALQKTDEKRINRITKQLQEILDRNPDIDLTVDANYMASNMSQWYSEAEVYTFRLKMNLILNAQIIYAFLEFVDKDYGNAFFSFRWILQYVSLLRTKYKKNVTSLDDYRIRTIVLNCSLYLARCLNLDFNHHKNIKYVSKRKIKINRLDVLKGLLCSVLENADLDIARPKSILETYSTAQFFCVCAEIYECMAILDGSIINYEHAQGLETLFIAPQRSLSVCMVRHYILASSYLPENDPDLLLCYHKILMGILFIRGLNKLTFSFFYQKLQKLAQFLDNKHSAAEYANFLLSGTFARVFEIINGDYNADILPLILIRLSTGEVLIEPSLEVFDSAHKHACSKEIRKLKQKVLGSPYDNMVLDDNDNTSCDFIEFWTDVYGA